MFDKHSAAPSGRGAGRLLARLGLCLLAAAAAQIAGAQVSVLTQDYDLARTGSNPAESTLTPANVSSTTFGKLYAYPVDEEIFAQPLYVPAVTIAGAAHNVIVAATMGNSVYAFDADSAATSNTPLWSVNLGTAIPSSKLDFFAGSGVSHNGIYSTPVIDPTTQTIYVVTHLWNTASQSISLQLHALSLLSGAEKFGGPVTLSASGFNADLAEQRAGLTLLNGVVYIPVASHADLDINMATQKKERYVGMVMAYNATTLAQVATFNAEPGGVGATMWQGGRGLVYDGTYLYAMTANALTLGTSDYSESFLQLTPGTLGLVSYYQDPDSTCLNTLDLDLAASGPQLILGQGSSSALVGGGKEGKVYTVLIDESLQAQTPSYIWGTSQHPTLPAEGGTCTDPRKPGQGWLQGSDTALWNPAGVAPYYYTFGNADELMSWQYAGGSLTSTSVDTPAANGGPIALAVSANGSANGILWVASRQSNGAALLSAYNATPSGGHLAALWNSGQVATRDALGRLGRYSVPTIANGKVYVGTGSNQVAVYGLLPQTPTVQLSPTSAEVTFTALTASTETINVNAIAGYTGTVDLSVIGLPTGFSAAFSTNSVTLTSSRTSFSPSLTISPANAITPLADSYTILVQASAAGGVTSYTPVRLYTRKAAFTSVTKVACNSSLQMDANVAWKIDGSSYPTLWIQDTTTPQFPGRPWFQPAPAQGNADTGYDITGKSNAFYWAIDQSSGAPANFDNALQVTNVRGAYSCP
jgi:hypothetical protein